MRMPDVMNSLRDILKKIKDASRLLTRLQVSMPCFDSLDIAYIIQKACQMRLVQLQDD